MQQADYNLNNSSFTHRMWLGCSQMRNYMQTCLHARFQTLPTWKFSRRAPRRRMQKLQFRAICPRSGAAAHPPMLTPWPGTAPKVPKPPPKANPSEATSPNAARLKVVVCQCTRVNEAHTAEPLSHHALQNPPEPSRRLPFASM